MRGRALVRVGVVLVAGGAAVACGVTPPTPTPGTGEPTDAPPTRAAPAPVHPAPKRWATVHWTRVEEPPFEVRGTSLFGVATDGLRIVAWGETTVQDGAAPGGSRTIFVLWTSNDGLTWRTHEVKRPTGEPFRVGSAVVLPSGYLVAGSSVGVPSLDVMTSVDADRWTEAGAWPVEARAQILPTADGFVTGGLRDGMPVFLASSDLSAWEAIPGPSQPGRYRIADVVRTAGGMLMAGAVESEWNWDGMLLGWSPGGPVVDMLGRNPLFVGPDRAVTIGEVVVHPGGIYLTGFVEGPDLQCALGGRIATTGPIVADVCGRTELAWASSDGIKWQELEALPPPAVPDAIAAGAAGLIALVEELQGGRDLGRVGLWTSPDGIEWWRVGDGIADPRHLIVLPGRVVTFHERPRDGRIAVWIGTLGG